MFPGVKFNISPDKLENPSFNHMATALGLGYIVTNENGINRNIGIFEVKLDEGIVLERNRVGLRNLLRKHWKNLDGAFIVYYQDSTSIWRFTYVSELTGFNDSGEYVNIKTDPKRYTYIFGEGESCKTAVERFLFLETKGSKVSIDDIIEAFSVEKLSKSFFDSYKIIYEEFCTYLTNKRSIFQPIFNGDDKELRDFTKLLLGRITFIYFIQKKGWLGVPPDGKWGEGDTQFLWNLYREYKPKSLFYKNVLTRLFFDSLNNPRENDLIELTKGKLIKIPFLNGGLFEEENVKYREIVFDEHLFDKLFEFFNQYNFTIYEDDPTEHTVAVDPEMLGHIFENLLEDNKDKGAFYTPKEIVHYMCQESLIEYLTTWFENKGYEVIGYASFKDINTPGLFSGNDYTTDQMEFELPVYDNQKKIDRILIEKLLIKTLDESDIGLIKHYINEFNLALDSVKICDPAIGSGAFPMGLLQEIFSAKQTLWFFKHKNLIDFPASEIKLNIIQNSIYGVDIEKGAVDIARLRFWLSLVVDEIEPKALPNLDYKIVVGNSLVSKLGEDIVDIDWNIDKANLEIFESELYDRKTDLIKKINQEQKEFFYSDTTKKKLSLNIRNLKIDLLITQLELLKATNRRENKLALSVKKMPTQTGIRLQSLGWDESIKQLKRLKESPEKPLNFFDWKLNFPEILNASINQNPGFDIVIGNPPYINIKNQTEETRNILKEKFKNSRGADIYVGFIELGFSLLGKNKPLAFIIPNKFFGAAYGKSIREEIRKSKTIITIWDLKDIKVFENAQISTIVFICMDKKTGYNTKIKKDDTVLTIDNIFDNTNKIQIESSDGEKDFLNKIFHNTTPLKLVSEIRTGIMGFEYWKMEPIIESLGKINSKNVPIYTNGNFTKYRDNWKTNEITLYKSKYIAPTISLDPLFLNKNTIELFIKAPKILVRGVSKQVSCIIDHKGCGLLVAVHSIIPSKINIYLLLGILNSKLINWVHLKTYYSIRIPQGSLKYPVEFFNSIPIPRDLVNNIKIQNLVMEVLTNIKLDQNICLFEQQIDNLVYRLFDLTYEEVKVIDPKFSLTEEEYQEILLE